MTELIILLVAIAISLYVTYLIIKAAINETVGKEIQRTNALLVELLKANNADISNIESKREKIKRINEQQTNLIGRVDRSEITQTQYDQEYQRLQNEKKGLK